MLRPLIGLAGLTLLFALGVAAIFWFWREMDSRGRPTSLRVLILVLAVFPIPVWLLLYVYDLRKHPPDTALSLRDRLTAPFTSTTPS